MEQFILRKEVRGINSKLIAHDLVLVGNKKVELPVIISSIIQNYNASDAVAGVPTILNIEDELINENLLEKIGLLARPSVIIQVNNRVLADTNKVTVLRRVRELNYKVLIEINKDDDRFNMTRALADIIKFDIQNIPDALLQDNGFTCKKLAYNVNKSEDYMLAESANIDYYEGEYIGTASQVEMKYSAHSAINFNDLIVTINDDKCTDEMLAKVISRDALLSAQLIRLANSDYFKTEYRIEYIEDAIKRISIRRLKRWVYLLQFSSKQHVNEELLEACYHRALFCRALMQEVKSKELTPEDAYIIGLFSELDVLSGGSMSKELHTLIVNPIIVNALIYREGLGGKLLNLIKAYEEVDWDRINKYSKEFKISKDRIFKIYYESVCAAATLWKEMTEKGDLK